MAALPLNDPERAVRESAARDRRSRRARHPDLLEHPGQAALGAGVPADFRDAWRRYDLPIWLHPYRGAAWSDYPAEQASEFEIWWTFGWPYETSVAMARIVFAGYFDRFPDLKVISHHMGAMAPYFEGRVGHGWDQLGVRTSDKDLSLV